MEGVGLILIGAALFSQSWYLLGLYPDGRAVGLYMVALGLAALMTITFTPQLLVGGPQAHQLAETTVMKMLIILWAGYAVGVGAQGLFDFDERAIGFYSAVLTAASVVSLFYFGNELIDPYGQGVTIVLSAVALVLSILAGMMFFYLAFPFQALQPVAGWFILVGSIAVTGVGLAVVTTVIVPKG